MGKANAGRGDKGSSSHPGQGGNWPSTTGNASGGGRGNATPSGGKGGSGGKGASGSGKGR